MNKIYLCIYIAFLSTGAVAQTYTSSGHGLGLYQNDACDDADISVQKPAACNIVVSGPSNCTHQANPYPLNTKLWECVATCTFECK